MDCRFTISGSMAGSPQSDPTGHVYPSCFSHMLPPLVPRRVTRCRPFCSTAGCPWDPLQGQVFGSRTSPIPAFPRPPPHLATTVGMGVQGFLFCRKLPGCRGKIQEGRSYTSLTELFHVVGAFLCPTVCLSMVPVFAHIYGCIPLCCVQGHLLPSPIICPWT